MDSPSSERPWLRVYPDWMPHDLRLTPSTTLDLFRTSVARRPENPAVYYFDHEISYSEIDRLSDSLAVALLDLGLQKGDRIALNLQNVPQFIIAQYAAWKAGSTVIPLNPMFKENELAYYLQDSGAKILITLEEIVGYKDLSFLKNTLTEVVITTSPLDMFPPEIELPPTLNGIKKTSIPGALDLMELLARYKGKKATDPGLFPDDVAFLTYTSRTMGSPRGAMNTHGNVVFNAGVYKVSALMDENDIVLGIVPLLDIMGEVAHLAVAALNAIPVILYYRFDPGEILRLIERWRATMTVAPASVFTALMNHPDIQHRDIRSFRKAYIGGASVPSAIVNKFEEVTGLNIYSVYGLTGTSFPSHITPFGKRMPLDNDNCALSVGLPVPNSFAKIMDLENGSEEVAPGEVGQIVVKGPMVIPGYWERCEQKEQTIKDEWLYTGDVGKMDQEGWFYVINGQNS